jgi:type II secretory pathway pseudopilin PulG
MRGLTNGVQLMTVHAARKRGFSLVEMMVAIVAGMIVSLAVITFMMSSMRSNGEYVQSTRLTQELRNTLDLIARDVSRAGYNDDALSYVSLPNTSPFAPIFIKDTGSAVTPGTSSTYANADTDGCILYAYDRTHPNGATAAAGTAGAVDVANGELRGMRRVVVNGVGVIEYAESSVGVTPACGGATGGYLTNPATCNATSGWCPLSDPTRVDVTRFMVIDKGNDVATSMRVRDIGLFLEGRPVNVADYLRAISSDVKIRADCVAPTTSDCRVAPGP